MVAKELHRLIRLVAELVEESVHIIDPREVVYGKSPVFWFPPGRVMKRLQRESDIKLWLAVFPAKSREVDPTILRWRMISSQCEPPFLARVVLSAPPLPRSYGLRVSSAISRFLHPRG